MTLTVGGLFSGIGGIELGLERAGMEVRWHSDIEPYCQAVLKHHWPDVPVYGDITEMKGEDLEPVDLICGGFPCQDISVAGRAAGLAGERSGLWSEYARLIGELRPRYVLMENVAALLGRGLGTVLGDLAALGYDAEYDCLPASAFGAHHRRDRIWIVAYPGSAGRRQDAGGAHGHESPDEGRSSSHDHVAERDGQSSGAGHVADAQGDGRRPRRTGRSVRDGQDRTDVTPTGMADSDHPGREERRRPEPVQAEHDSPQCGGEDVADSDSEPTVGPSVAWDERDPWTVEPEVARVVDGLPGRVDRVRALGNAVVPQIPEWIGRRILDYENALDLEVAA